MTGQTLIKTGIIGAVIAAIFCVTPILVIALDAVGLSALTDYLGAVLPPVLALSIGLVGYGLYERRQCAADAVNTTTTGT